MAPPASLADRIQLYLDDNPYDGGHSDAAGGDAWELLEEAMGELRHVAQPSSESLTAIIRPMIESVCSDGHSNAARLAKEIADAIIAKGISGHAYAPPDYFEDLHQSRPQLTRNRSTTDGGIPRAQPMPPYNFQEPDNGTNSTDRAG
jgi:hypothetical protein